MAKKNKPIFNLKQRINPIDGEGYFNDEKSILVNELHAPYKQKYEKRAYIYRYLGETQIDIADFNHISQYNYGVRIKKKKNVTKKTFFISLFIQSASVHSRCDRFTFEICLAETVEAKKRSRGCPCT